MKYAGQPQTCRICGLTGHFLKDCPKSQKEARAKKAQPESPESKSKGKSPESKDTPMETQSSTSQVTQAEIMDTPCTKEPVQEHLEELHVTEPVPAVLHSPLDDVIGSVFMDEDDIHSVDSLDKDQDDSPAQEFSTLPKQDLAQATQAWADAKDEAERTAGLKPCCPLCRTDSHTEGQCVAARIRQACKKKSSAGEHSKPGNVSIRKKRTLKGSSMTSSRSCSRGRIRMTLSMCWRLTVIRTFLHAICCRFLALLLRVKSRRVIAWPGKRTSWISG